MRLASTIKPTPIPDLECYKLNRLEIVPCEAHQFDPACFLVRYFNYEQDNVEGNHFFETVAEVLNYVEEIYGIRISEWRIDGTEQTFLDFQEMYKSVLHEHLHRIKAPEC
ncbi:hypothetical protein ABGV49_16455 [Chromobacterium vaccinii]|uniref:Uncharacterized protein n=1 Tax=Chromobacterium vaccinii TaxID=1108595 RepID=A0ABV0FHJ6_9NEIS